MYQCIANNENMFLILDSKDGVCEWTTIQECRKYLESNVSIQGLCLKFLDNKHTFIDFNPVFDFIPSGINSEIKSNCNNELEYLKLVDIVKSFILRGNNIIRLRKSCDSYNSFIQRLIRWCYNG